MNRYPPIPWRIFKYLQHLLHFRHRRGHGIHSPYLFDFIHRVIFNAEGAEVPSRIREVHEAMRRECSLIPEEEGGYGAGSGVGKRGTRTISSFVKKSSVSGKYGALLYRITRWFQPDVILELGTGLGISGSYLSAGAPGTTMYTVEGSKLRAAISGQVFKRCGLVTVKLVQEELGQALDKVLDELQGRAVVFVDANHRFGPTVEYLEAIMQRVTGEAVIVIDDIYWSREMHRAWKKVARWPRSRVSIDLFRMGILLLRPDLQKMGLKINF